MYSRFFRRVLLFRRMLTRAGMLREYGDCACLRQCPRKKFSIRLWLLDKKFAEAPEVAEYANRLLFFDVSANNQYPATKGRRNRPPASTRKIYPNRFPSILFWYF